MSCGDAGCAWSFEQLIAEMLTTHTGASPKGTQAFDHKSLERSSILNLASYALTVASCHPAVWLRNLQVFPQRSEPCSRSGSEIQLTGSDHTQRRHHSFRSLMSDKGGDSREADTSDGTLAGFSSIEQLLEVCNLGQTGSPVHADPPMT